MARSENRITFTVGALSKLPTPQGGKRAFYYDQNVPGLALQITGSGIKTFYVVKQVKSNPGEKGKTEKIYLGKYPDLTVEQARVLARQKLGEIALGLNPAEVKRQAKTALTFGQLFNQYVEMYARYHVKTVAEMEASYRRYFVDRWATARVSSIKKTDVQDWVNALSDVGKHTANRSFDTFRAVINWGIKKDLVLPAVQTILVGIDLNTLKSRDRYLTEHEFQAFAAALSEYPNEMLRDFFWMCIMTAARKSNVLSMRWEDLDLDSALWKIPETKNGDSHTVPLLLDAVALLRQRQARCNGSEWVFPSDGQTGHLVEPKAAWRMIVKSAGLKDLRIHDLRRTAGSWMAQAGYSRDVIGKLLGHRSFAATGVYARVNLGAVRDALGQTVGSSVADLSRKRQESDEPAVALRVVP